MIIDFLITAIAPIICFGYSGVMVAIASRRADPSWYYGIAVFFFGMGIRN